MNLVAAVDRNWAIGNKGQLLVRIPDDMRNFRSLTEGNVVILGRKTLDTFPGGKPLKNRVNIIMTRKPQKPSENVLTAGSVEEALRLAGQYNSEDVYVIGGTSVYRQFMPYVDTAYITYIDYSYEADAYMQNLDTSDGWVLTEESGEQTYFDVEYYFRKYEKKD